MEVRVYGLGYVGLVTALGIAKSGVQVQGIELSQEKVNQLSRGELHIYEPGLDDWFKEVVDKDLFSFSTEARKCKSGRLVSFLCVGTPMGARGRVDLSQFRSVLKSIKSDLADSELKEALIVVRSTIPPGTSVQEVLPILTEIEKANSDIQIDYLFYPEFLREGEALFDFMNPKLTVFGTFQPSKEVEEKWNDFLSKLPLFKPCHWVGVNTAEMMKYAQNSYNALRISFANELATVAAHHQVEIDELQKLMKTNQSNEANGMYLRPGFSYGGPCLVKEVEALSWMGRNSGHDLPLISSISSSNETHYERFLSLVESYQPKKLLILGVSFKPETDDLRNSYLVKLIDDLTQKPSYKSKIKITVIEKPEALEKVKRSWVGNESVNIKLQDELSTEVYDLVVFGSFRADNKLKTFASSNCKNSINLGFFDEIACFNF